DVAWVANCNLAHDMIFDYTSINGTVRLEVLKGSLNPGIHHRGDVRDRLLGASSILVLINDKRLKENDGIVLIGGYPYCMVYPYTGNRIRNIIKIGNNYLFETDRFIAGLYGISFTYGDYAVVNGAVYHIDDALNAYKLETGAAFTKLMVMLKLDPDVRIITEDNVYTRPMDIDYNINAL
ncbi:hypothetical protein HNP86_001763, partial [Methanococcus maripaludis]